MIVTTTIASCNALNFVDKIQLSLGNCEPMSSVNSHYCDSFKDCLERADEFKQNENEYVSQTIKMASLIDALTCDMEFHPDAYPLDNMINMCSKCRGM